MNLLERIQETILRLFPVYRELVRDWEQTNRNLDGIVAKKNCYKRQIEELEQQRTELIKRCYDVIDMVEDTRLKRITKDKIIDKLRGLK